MSIGRDNVKLLLDLIEKSEKIEDLAQLTTEINKADLSNKQLRQLYTADFISPESTAKLADILNENESRFSKRHLDYKEDKQKMSLYGGRCHR